MPAFRAGYPSLRVHLAANVVLAPGFQLMPFDAVDWDDVSAWDGTSTYTCDRPGLWDVGGQVRRDVVATSSNVFPRLMLNGVQEIGHPQLNTTAAQVGAVSGHIRTEEGDTLSLEVRLHSTLSATATAGSCFFWLARIGPKRWT